MYDSRTWIRRYIKIFLFQGLNGVGKNEFVFQFTCLQPHLYMKIHTPRTTLALENGDEQHFN